MLEQDKMKEADRRYLKRFIDELHYYPQNALFTEDQLMDYISIHQQKRIIALFYNNKMDELKDMMNKLGFINSGEF